MPKISIKVKPGSKLGPKVEPLSDGSYIVYIRERAKEGEANTALVKLLSEYFDVPKTSLKIKSGLASKHKIVEF